VDALGDNGEHACHVAVDCLAAGCGEEIVSTLYMYALSVKTELTLFENHGHGTTLVQNTQLALGSLLVGRVGEDATVEQCPVCIRNHGSDVTSRVRLLGILDGFNPLLGRHVPVLAVAFVARVDATLLGNLHVGVGENELAEGVVHGEAVDGAALHGHNELGGSAVHGETGSDEVCAGAEEVLLGAISTIGKSVDTKDCADRNTGVQVARAIDRVASNSVFCVGAGRELNELVFLLGHQNADTAGRAHSRDEDVIADYVELLLVVASGVCGTCEAAEVDQTRTANVVCDRFEGELESMAEEAVRVRSARVSREHDGAIVRTYVKSPVASACLVCSSLRCLVRVMMSVLIFSSLTAPPDPLADIFVDM
jgi:hypothetical protein